MLLLAATYFLLRQKLQTWVVRSIYLLVVLFVTGGSIGLIRVGGRYNIYRSAAEGKAFDVHELFAPLAEKLGPMAVF